MDGEGNGADLSNHRIWRLAFLSCPTLPRGPRPPPPPPIFPHSYLIHLIETASGRHCKHHLRKRQQAVVKSKQHPFIYSQHGQHANAAAPGGSLVLSTCNCTSGSTLLYIGGYSVGPVTFNALWVTTALGA